MSIEIQEAFAGIFTETTYINYDNSTLGQFETALKQIQEGQQASWLSFYRIIKAIEKSKAYYPTYLSMTAWIKSYCRDKNNAMSENKFYEIKRAGRILDEYQDRTGEIILYNKISPEILVNFEKAVLSEFGTSKLKEKFRLKKLDSLIKEALEGKFTRDQSREIYKEQKKRTRAEHLQLINMEPVKKNTFLADEIKRLVKADHQWLGNKERPSSNFFHKPQTRDLYKVFEEFTLYKIGENIRRIDLAVFSNIKSENPLEVDAIGIEIKTNRDDLLSDIKYLDYTDYFDYLYILTSEEVLAEIQPDLFPEGIGIIAYKTNTNKPRIREGKDRFVFDDYTNLQQSLIESEDVQQIYIVREADRGLPENIDITLRRYATKAR